jgi:hypothetical protein
MNGLCGATFPRLDPAGIAVRDVTIEGRPHPLKDRGQNEPVVSGGFGSNVTADARVASAM